MDSYVEHPGKVVATHDQFTHVMAIALDPRSKYQEGVIRCIVNRDGDVGISGYIDRSELHKITGRTLEGFVIGEKLKIKNEDEVIRSLTEEGLEFIGLEDPDIWIDNKTDLLHLYFTIPMIDKIAHNNKIHLGHAEGIDLDSLVMTEPVLKSGELDGAKELSIAPVNSKGVRFNLIESSQKEMRDFTYSVVKTAIARDMGESWEFGETVFHPAEHGVSWIGGHASPGPLFSKEFVDIGEGKLLGIMNGREANLRVENQIIYGIFSIGLFIYDYENGKIEWVSEEPLIRDSLARTITFASQFIETESGKGILYAHVDDSFVRAYTLEAEKLKKLIPAKYLAEKVLG